MTVNTNVIVSGPYTGTGVADEYDYDFRVENKNQLAVYEYTDLGVESLLTVDVDYTVNNIGNDAGGTVTRLAGVLPTDYQWVIRANYSATQSTAFRSQGGFKPQVHEAAMDKLTFLVQQLEEELSRAVKVSIISGDDPDALISSIEASEAAAAVSAAAALASEVAAAADAVLTAADVVLTNADVTYAAEWANKAEDILISIAAGGDGVDDYSSLHHANKASASATAAALSAASAAGTPARNAVQNQEALSQGESTRGGMESLLGTNASGITTTGGDFGYLRWTKDRNNVQSHSLSDSVRGDFYLSSNSTAAEVATVPTVTTDDVTWTFQATKKTSGLTNRNKAYTCHYNPDMNFSIVGYQGDGVNGHEVPHHLGVVPELSIIKNRDAVTSWIVKSSLLPNDDYLRLETTAAQATDAAKGTLPTDTTLSLSTESTINGSSNNMVMYNFTSKSGVCKIGKYIGTGAAGNYISTEVDGGDAFKPSFVMVKSLGSGNWNIIDSVRGDNKLFPNISNADQAEDAIDFVDDGFVCKNTSGDNNAVNTEYIFIAFAETSIDASKAIANYDYATTPDTLSIAQDTLISVANGFNANGEVNTQFQFGAGVTNTYGVGHENKHYYIYSDKLGNRGVSETRPLVGLTRKDADRYGEVSPTDALALDSRSRTTSKHFDYESPSGVVLASGEHGTGYAYQAFDKDQNDIVNLTQWRIAATTTSWLQYKHNEKRILKSWRLREGEDATRTPDNFTIEGSNDGLNWTAIDSAYAVTDFDTVSNGAYLWSPLQDVSSNTTAYLYHRINITANNGDATYTAIAELELNTVLATDYYLVNEGKMYNSSDVAIERMYLGEFKTDADGDVIKESIINATPAKQQITEAEVHGDLTVHSEIKNRGVCTAWVNFDGTQNPPLIRDSYNVADVVDNGTGNCSIIFETPMDSISYTVIGTMDNTAGGGSILSALINGIRTTKVIQIIDARVTGAVDRNNVEVSIFGGKKIL